MLTNTTRNWLGRNSKFQTRRLEMQALRYSRNRHFPWRRWSELHEPSNHWNSASMPGKMRCRDPTGDLNSVWHQIDDERETGTKQQFIIPFLTHTFWVLAMALWEWALCLLLLLFVLICQLAGLQCVIADGRRPLTMIMFDSLGGLFLSKDAIRKHIFQATQLGRESNFGIGQ